MKNFEKTNLLISNRVFEKKLENSIITSRNLKSRHRYKDEWYKYWMEHGDEIVNISWLKLQGSIFDLNSEESEILSSKNINLRKHCINYQGLREKWLQLWKDNYKEQYTKCFNEWFLRNILENNIDESENSTDSENSFSNSDMVRNKALKKKSNKRKKKINLPPDIANDKSLFKYWRKRFLLFSKFEQGIKLDKESWFSVTPEKIAIHISEKFKNFDIVIDGFCGCGGNTIQLAKKCKKVIAIDIDPKKILMAKNNAKIYNVENNIEFIIGDFFVLSQNLKADAVFLSPPWGGPSYAENTSYDIETQLQPSNASNLFEKSRNISNNIAFFLPRNSNMEQIIRLAKIGNTVKVEKNYFGDKIVAMTAFYGNFEIS